MTLSRGPPGGAVKAEVPSPPALPQASRTSSAPLGPPCEAGHGSYPSWGVARGTLRTGDGALPPAPPPRWPPASQAALLAAPCSLGTQGLPPTLVAPEKGNGLRLPVCSPAAPAARQPFPRAPQTLLGARRPLSSPRLRQPPGPPGLAAHRIPADRRQPRPQQAQPQAQAQPPRRFRPDLRPAAPHTRPPGRGSCIPGPQAAHASPRRARPGPAPALPRRRSP